MAFSEDTIEFTVVKPSWRTSPANPYTCKAFTLVGPENGASTRKITGMGTVVCYSGPGDEIYTAIARISETNFDDYQDALREVLLLNECTVSITVTPGDKPTRNIRNPEDHDNVFIRGVAPGVLETGTETYAQDFVFDLVKLGSS